MPTVYVNDQPVEIGDKKLNCVQVAELAGVLVPHYCYHPGLSVVASCRMCMIEMGDLKDGKVTMIPKVFPGCQTPVKDGTVIVTGDYEKRNRDHHTLTYDASYKAGERAKKSQADTLEGLLLNHPLDCPVCDKAGECKLQDYSYQYGRSQSRMVDEKNQPPNKPELSSKITLFTDRCIMCTRCVRFTREISGTSELQVVGRGHHEEIDVFPGYPLENKLSGNVVDLCPVGALGSKDFLYTQRVWYLKSAESVCSRCSTGCSIHVDTNKDLVYRIRSRENPDAQGYWICDEGRWGYAFAQSEERIQKTLLRGDDRKLRTLPAHQANLKPRISQALMQNASRSALVLSPFLTLEEAYQLCLAAKTLSPQITLMLGPIPKVGEDDHYPKDRRGQAVAPSKFTIHAEKCPNRAGVEAVLKHLQGSVINCDFTELSTFECVYFVGGYPSAAAIDQELPDQWQPPKSLIVQDLFHSKLTRFAQLVLPATTSFEKSGTFVNHAGKPQQFARAIQPASSIRTELQLAYELAGKPGIANSSVVRRELATVFPELIVAEAEPTERRVVKVELQTV